MNLKILITELMWEEGLKVLQEEGYEVNYNPDLVKDRVKLLSIVSEYDALIVRNQTKVDKELLEKAINIKVIGRLGVGLDNIDLGITNTKNIKVVVAKHANATSVAEYVLATMLNESRDIFSANKDVKEGNWDRKKFTKGELDGKTIGLFGLGEIAHRVARRAQAFGMKVLGFDPFITPYDNVLAETGVTRIFNLDGLLKKSDFISIHVPLTETTINSFNMKAFTKMKSNAVIINTARGKIINENDLCIAVKMGKIKGAYLDVLEEEPINKDSPLLACENIKITPHIAGLTLESQIRISRLVAEEVIKVLKGQLALCVVN